MEFSQLSSTLIQVLFVVLLGAGIFAVVLLIKTARQALDLISQTATRIIPLLDKADVTVDAVNAEILRVDGIVTQIEEVSGTVSSTTRVATELIRSPVSKAAEVGARLIGGMRHKH